MPPADGRCNDEDRRERSKHGVEDEAMVHAVRNYARVFDLDEVAMFIDPAEDGAMLEVGVVEDDDDPRIIHAMPARQRFWP